MPTQRDMPHSLRLHDIPAIKIYLTYFYFLADSWDCFQLFPATNVGCYNILACTVSIFVHWHDFIYKENFLQFELWQTLSYCLPKRPNQFLFHQQYVEIHPPFQRWILSNFKFCQSDNIKWKTCFWVRFHSNSNFDSRLGVHKDCYIFKSCILPGFMLEVKDIK